MHPSWNRIKFLGFNLKLNVSHIISSFPNYCRVSANKRGNQVTILIFFLILREHTVVYIRIDVVSKHKYSIKRKNEDPSSPLESHARLEVIDLRADRERNQQTPETAVRDEL